MQTLHDNERLDTLPEVCETITMLIRVLEPEVMDTAEEALAYDAMDHRVVNEAFVSDLLAAGDLSGKVLDLGTGTALIPIELCRHRDGLHVVAVDLAAAMLERARDHLAAAQCADRITLQRCDAKDLPYVTGTFDVVISNSILHHLAHPRQALAEAVRVTRSGGLLFFRDLVRPASEADVQRLVQQYAGAEPPFAQDLFANSLRAALTVAETQALIVDLGFPAASVAPTSDRHWTWSARKGTLH